MMDKFSLIVALALAACALAGCDEVNKATGTGCYAHADQATCTAPNADGTPSVCHWNAKEARCKG